MAENVQRRVGPDRDEVNAVILVDPVGDYVTTTAVTTQAGSQFVEGIRDDIFVSFDTDTTDTEISLNIEDVATSGGSYSRDMTEGRGVFSTGAAAGSRVYYQSVKHAVYEPGHEIAGEQTIEVDITNLVGDAVVEWGYGRDDGSGGLLHHIGWRLTPDGLYAVRRKNGVDEHVAIQSDWNRDTLSGQEGSRFTVNGSPVSLGLDKNMLWRISFEWLGVAPPTWKAMMPPGGVLPVHIEETVGQLNGTTIPTPRLQLFIRAQNDSTLGGDISVSSGSWRGGIHTSKTVLTARQPDGDYVDSRSDGSAFMETTPLGPAGVFTSPWFDSDGWTTIELFIATDQVSATGGVELQFTDDAQAATPTLRGSETFTFGAGDVARGYSVIRRGAALDGFRIVYTNGGLAQSVFYIEATLRVAPSGPPLNSLESDVDDTSIVQQARTALFAKDPNENYGLIGRGLLGGLDANVTEHEVNTPIKPDTAIESNAATVTATASKIIDFTAVPVGTTAIQIQAGGANNQKIYFSESGSRANQTSAGFELDAGQAQYLSLGEDLTTDLWAASSSGTQRYRILYIKGGGA